MAKQAIVELSDFKVTIKELRIKDILNVISNIKEVFDDELNVQQLVEEKFDLIVSIASDFIVVDDSEYSLDDLTFSDIDLLTPAFKEVNASFLDKLTSMGITPQVLAQDLMPSTEAENDLAQMSSDEESTTQ